MLKRENQKEKKVLKEEIASKLDDITAVVEEQPEVTPVILNQADVTKIDETHVKIENQMYEVVVDYREAFQVEAIAERHNSILNKYDYIVGDWGYDQLRLKGFFDESNNRAPFDKKIDFLEDYLFEFCNFGCAYFVLEKEKSEKSKKSKTQRKKKTKRTEDKKTESKKLETKKPETKKPEIKKTESKKLEPKNDRSNRKASTSPAPKRSPQPQSNLAESDKRATEGNQNKEFVIKKSENKKPHTQVKNNKLNVEDQETPKTDFKIHTTKDEK